MASRHCRSSSNYSACCHTGSTCKCVLTAVIQKTAATALSSNDITFEYYDHRSVLAEPRDPYDLHGTDPCLSSPCACGTIVQARQGVAPQAERFFCVLNALWQAATAGEKGRSHQSTKKTPDRALHDECASERESAAKVCGRERVLGGRDVGLRPSWGVLRDFSPPNAMGRRPIHFGIE